jgi:dephospho-CoA kinase
MMTNSKDKAQHNIIGLTGGIGCGKTTVSNLFAAKGIAVIDADVIAREVVLPNTVGLRAITDKFSYSILLPNKTLDRAKLRDIIFQDDNAKKWLENLLHPLIRDKITTDLTTASVNSRYVILSSPLLLETDQHTLVNKTIVIDIAPDSQLERAMYRDSNSKEQIQRIIDKQISRAQRNSRADFIINNNNSLQETSSAVDELHLKLSKELSSTKD